MINGAYANVLDFGAVGNGIADDSAAVQAAIDLVKTKGGGVVYLPTGTYKIGTTLNATNFGNIPLMIKGEGKTDGFPSSTSQATNLLGSTGAFAVIETQGSNGVVLDNFNIYTQATDSNKSRVGIFIGRTATVTAGEFNDYRNVGIYLRTVPGVNAGAGAVGLWNLAGEHGLFSHVEIIADTALLLFETDLSAGQPVYTPKYAAISNVASCTLNTFVQCAFISLSVCAMQIRGIVTTSFIDCYYGNSSGTGNLPTAVVVLESTSNIPSNIFFSGQMENWNSFIRFNAIGCKNIQIKVTVAGAHPTEPLVTADVNSSNIYALSASFQNPAGYALSLLGTILASQCTFTGGVFVLDENTSITDTNVFLRGVQFQDTTFAGNTITVGAESSYSVIQRNLDWESITYGIPLMTGGIGVKTPDGTKTYIIAVDNAGAVTSTLKP